jgi:hypothetical protein
MRKASQTTIVCVNSKPHRGTDAKLITTMLRYGVAIGTALTVCKLEPGGNCDRSAAIAARAFGRARDCIVQATALPAQTMEGLSGKARAVPFIFRDDEGGTISAEHVAYLTAFAEDAKRLAEAAIEAARNADAGKAVQS